MERNYSIWQLILFSAIAFFLISGAIYIGDRITNPDGIWCVRYSPNGTETQLRGADCNKP